MGKPYDRKDHFYEKAKDSGFRSRAAFKLQELDGKFKFLKHKFRILDLGAWPGGWLQVAARKVGPSGVVVGIDLVDVEPFVENNLFFIKGDARDEAVLTAAREHAPEGFDAVLSDMSPKLTGIREVDNAATVGCAELAYWIAEQQLKPGGTLVIKLFMSQDSQDFVKQVRPFFEKVHRIELDSTRSTSKEFYLVGVNWKPQNRA